jgi:hypothetical protein
MYLQTRKKAFVQEFLSIQSEEVVSCLENYFKKAKTSMEERLLNPIPLKKGIEESIAQN